MILTFVQHKVRSKSYAATMIADEKLGKVVSVQCHDCAASTGGCKHAVAVLMWVHRRSEEAFTTEIQCYWKKSKLAQVGNNLKFITSKDLSHGERSSSKQFVSQNDVVTQFLQEATDRGVTNCELLKYNGHKDYEKLSLHYLIMEHSEDGDCGSFLNAITQYFTEKNIALVEENTRSQIVA